MGMAYSSLGGIFLGFLLGIFSTRMMQNADVRFVYPSIEGQASKRNKDTKA